MELAVTEAKDVAGTSSWEPSGEELATSQVTKSNNRCIAIGGFE